MEQRNIECYIMQADEDKAFQIDIQSRTSFADALSSARIAGEPKGMGAIRNLRYGYQVDGMGYQIFKDERGVRHVIAIAKPWKTTEMRDIIRAMRPRRSVVSIGVYNTVGVKKSRGKLSVKKS